MHILYQTTSNCLVVYRIRKCVNCISLGGNKQLSYIRRSGTFWNHSKSPQQIVATALSIFAKGLECIHYKMTAKPSTDRGKQRVHDWEGDEVLNGC